MVDVGFFVDALYQVKDLLLYPYFAQSFMKKTIEFFSNAFCVPIEIIMFSSLVYQYMVNHLTLHPGINHTL